MPTARFITLEGIDGAGKSSHLDALVAWIRERGHAVTATREPGGTPLGERLRDLVLGHPMGARSEALLMFAARQEHVEQVIRPALARGEWVVSDRFSDASFAYQGGGRGVPDEALETLEAWVQQGLQPDLTFWFDLEPQTARARVLADGRVLDRFEQEQGAFFQRVRAAYLRRAERFPQRIARIDASQDRATVRAALTARLARL